MSYITEAFKELKDIDKDELQKELNTQGVTEDKYIAEEYISEGEAKTDRKLKTEVI